MCYFTSANISHREHKHCNAAHIIIIIIIIIKKTINARPRESDWHSISPMTRAPQHQPIEGKKKKQ